MYALWIDCCEPCCFLQNDDKFLTLLQSKIVEHITGKGMPNTQAIIRFIQSATSLEDLTLLAESFINNSFPYCSIKWTIVEVSLPEHVVDMVEPVNVVDEVLE